MLRCPFAGLEKHPDTRENSEGDFIQDGGKRGRLFQQGGGWGSTQKAVRTGGGEGHGTE